MMGLRVFLIGVFCAFGQAVFGQTAQFIAAIPFHDSDARFGGFSGLSLSNNGRDMVALSDRGAIFRGRIVRDDLDAPVDPTNPLRRLDFIPTAVWRGVKPWRKRGRIGRLCAYRATEIGGILTRLIISKLSPNRWQNWTAGRGCISVIFRNRVADL